MQNMRGRMIQGGRLAFSDINTQRDLVSFFDLSGNYVTFVDDKPGGILDRIHNFHFKILTGDFSGIADLAAGLCIKRRFRSHQFDGLAGNSFRNFGAIGNDQHNL